MPSDTRTDVSPARRKNMQAIRSKNTKPETLFRKSLFARGYRYRIAPKNIRGKPDLWMPRLGAAIFINGCFWHAHNCELFRVPKTRKDFWLEKLRSNVNRDIRTYSELQNSGIRILVIWECSFKKQTRITLPLTVSLAITWLESGKQFGTISESGLSYSDSLDDIHISGTLR